MLAKLGVTPMEIGISLVSALEDKDMYMADILDIDTDKFIAQIRQAYTDALKLGVEREIMTLEVTEYLLAKAERDAKALEAYTLSSQKGAGK